MENLRKKCNLKLPEANDPKYICNPKTGRWIKKDGATAKNL